MKPLIDAEQWLPIVGYEGHYEISNFGRVYSVPRKEYNQGRHQQPVKRSRKGGLLTLRKGVYLNVTLHKGGKPKIVNVHRLVAKHFVDNPNGFPEVNHLDEDRHNNRWDNLEWTTRSGNAKHSCHKTTGSKCGTSKLTEEQVLEIADLLCTTNLKQTEIAKLYGVSNHTIFRIKAGDNWAWLTGFGKEGKAT